MDENFCEECMKREITSVPSVHCFECDFRICNTCKNKHLRSRVKKKHHLIRIDDAPEVALLSFLKTFRTCPNHPKEEVVFQCDSHDVICCGVCATEAHKGCGGVRSLVEASKMAKDKDAKNAILIQYDEVSERVRKAMEKFEGQKGAFETSTVTLNKRFDELKDYMSTTFEEFSGKTIAIFEEQAVLKARLKQDFNNMGFTSRKIKEYIILSDDSGDNVKTYLSMKKMQNLLKDLEVALEQSFDEPEIPEFQTLKQSISDSFCVPKKEKYACCGPGLNKPSTSAGDFEMIPDTNKRKPILMHSFAVDDNIAFSDCTWMNEEHIVLIDPAFHKLYNYNVYQNTTEDLLKLPTLPWCVEAIDTDVVAVSLHGERLVRFYKVVPGQASIMETMYVNDMCFGMQYIKDESALYVLFKSLLVLTEKQAEIRIFAIDPKNLISAEPNVPNYINHNNRKLGTIDLDKEATEKLARSTSFRITKDRKLLILCCATHEVCFINIAKGSIVSKYDPDLFNPVFVDSDYTGYVYVVWSTNSTIHMLRPDGEFVKEILTSQDGLAQPTRLCFNNDCDKFIVIDQYRRKQLKIFTCIIHD